MRAVRRFGYPADQERLGGIAADLTHNALTNFHDHINFHAGDDALVVNRIEFNHALEYRAAMARVQHFDQAMRWVGTNELWGASAQACAKINVAEGGG